MQSRSLRAKLYVLPVRKLWGEEYGLDMVKLRVVHLFLKEYLYAQTLILVNSIPVKSFSFLVVTFQDGGVTT